MFTYSNNILQLLDGNILFMINRFLFFEKWMYHSIFLLFLSVLHAGCMQLINYTVINAWFVEKF